MRGKKYRMIGLLTYHNNQVKGAVLQAYCLVHTLEKTVNVKTEIIDYRPLSKEISRLISKKPLKFKKNISDYLNTERFLKKHCKLSSKRITTNNFRKAIQFIKKLNYDMVVVGSDVVWMIKKARAHGRLLLDRPFPNAYFLDPSLDSIKVSYGASADRTNMKNITDKDKIFLRKHLNAFDRISVRDHFTEHFLHELGIEEVARVPDPTLLTDIPVCNVADFLEKNGISIDNPILGVHRVVHPIMKKVCDRYRERGFQIVSPTTHPYADFELFSKVNPIQYYSLYQHFDMVITSSFHSTIFAIKNNTPFITVDIENVYKTVESKTYSLLKDFDLLERHIDLTNGISKDFIQRMEEYEKRLSESNIRAKMASLQKQGISYISNLKELLISDS